MFSELVMACLLAGAPTSLSPSLVKATTEGVVLTPYEFSSTLGVLPSIRATHELVVPRSIPIMEPDLALEKFRSTWELNIVRSIVERYYYHQKYNKLNSIMPIKYLKIDF